MALVNVDVTLNATTINSVYVGGLAGIVGTGGVTIEDSYTTGRVRAGESSTNPVTFTSGRKVNYVGGLVGGSGGDIVSSYSLADVTGYSKSTRANIVTYAGGLAGLVGTSGSGSVSASYAGGDVSANTVAKNTIEAFAGGLVGRLEGSVSASYARGDASASNDATDFFNFRAYSYAGGLVGYQAANVTASFSTGAATATGDGTNKQAGGLVGHRNSGTTTDSYWDTSTSGITATGQGTGKTTSELQTPTAYGTGNVHLQGLEPGLRLRFHQRRPLGLRHGVPVPRPEVRRANRVPAARHRHAHRVAHNHLGARADHPQPRESKHVDCDAGQRMGQANRHHRADQRLRVYAGRVHLHFQRRIHHRPDHHHDRGKQPGTADAPSLTTQSPSSSPPTAPG